MTDTPALGSWVVVPDGRIGHAWAPHPDGARVWVAFGGDRPEAFLPAELEPAEGSFSPITEQEGLPL